jgi:hypothetical protein
MGAPAAVSKAIIMICGRSLMHFIAARQAFVLNILR